MTYRLSSRDPAETRTNNSETESPKIKIFFVFEGAKTEPIYFDSFIDKYSENTIGEFIILDRLDHSLSNQKSVTIQIEHFLNTCETLDDSNIKKINETIDYLKSTSLTQVNFQELRSDLETHGLTEDALNLIFKTYPNNNMLHLAVMETLVKLKGYQKNFDKVCIVIDRDTGSFTADQFDDVIKICSSNDFNLGLSNPCFELFLYLHLDNLNSLDKVKILENKRSRKNAPTFMEKSLKSYLKTQHNSIFNKNNFDANLFIDNFSNISENIEQSQIKIDNLDLKTNIGTSVYNMLSSLLNE
ncbi:RloB family protein [Acinetobacter guillouiae]|uniref:RloB family protein n=1 Tax=Acinetobacter guillouiae TaxID=106649 RepID=UPI003AF79815